MCGLEKQDGVPACELGRFYGCDLCNLSLGEREEDEVGKQDFAVM